MRVRVAEFGPIKQADVTLGDLTVLVGPQATGKSIFLQLLKLLLDKRSIHEEMRRFGLDWSNADEFQHLYFGEGMADLWQAGRSNIRTNGGRPVSPTQFARSQRRRNRSPAESALYIPAQRVMSLRDGFTRPFSDYRVGDPFVLRAFSEKLHQLVQTDFASSPGLFPKRNRLKQVLRQPLVEHVFGGFELKTEAQMQRRIVLENQNGTTLPYLVWSAGQREVVPLLLGFYHLLPPGGASRRDDLEWVVIEEPEMGLHPYAITAVLSVVTDLLARQYRVCLSTHSPHVLDLLWALRFIQENDGNVADARRLLGLGTTGPATQLASAALGSELRVYYFTRDGTVQNISQLDPGADDDAERDWGGLTEFAGIAGDIVAEVANRRG